MWRLDSKPIGYVACRLFRRWAQSEKGHWQAVRKPLGAGSHHDYGR